MGILLRLLLLIALIIIIYSFWRYWNNSRRKLEAAHHKKQFYLLDDQQNVRKNLLATHKGVMFEGEKYVGTTEKAFEVVTISLWVIESEHLRGFQREDFTFLEREILSLYPEAAIEWNSPVKEFMQQLEAKQPQKQ